MSSTMRFSNPSPRSFEKGRLLGSAQTRSSRACAPDAATIAKQHRRAASLLWEGEIIEHSPLGGGLLEVPHGVEEAEGTGAVARVEIGGNDDARPASDAGQ